MFLWTFLRGQSLSSPHRLRGCVDAACSTFYNLLCYLLLLLGVYQKSESKKKKLDELVRYVFFIASASPSSSKVSNSTGQFRGLSSNQSFPPDFPVAKAVIITVNNCLVWWLWTSACGVLNSPQTVRIKSSSIPFSPWLSPRPAFTAFSSLLLFPIFLSLSHNMATLLAASLPLPALSNSRQAHTHKHMSAKQKPFLVSGVFSFSATWKAYKGAKQTSACHTSTCCSHRKIL